MKIKFTCPAGHKLQAQPSKAGSTIACPVCQVMVVVPPPRGSDTPSPNPNPPRPVKRPPAAPSTRAPRGAPPPLPEPRPASDPAVSAASRNRWAGEVPLPGPKQSPGPNKSNGLRPPPLPSPSSPEFQLGESGGQARPLNSGPPTSDFRPPISDLRLSTSDFPSPERGHAVTVYWLGLSLFLTALTQLAPACGSFGPAGAPTWARLLVVLSAVQVVYVLWMVSLPDFSTVWVVMLVYASAAGAYGIMLLTTALAPRSRPMLFELDDVGRLAPAWCAAMLLLTLLAACLCARTSTRWYKAYLAEAGEAARSMGVGNTSSA